MSLSLSSVGISAGFGSIIILKNFSFLLLGEEGLLHFLKCCCTSIDMISRIFYFTLSVELITRSLPNAERSLHSWGKAYRVMVCFLLIHWKFHPASHLQHLLSSSHPSLLRQPLDAEGTACTSVLSIRLYLQ